MLICGPRHGQIFRVHDDVVISERVIFPKSHRETLMANGAEAKRIFEDQSCDAGKKRVQSWLA